MAYRISCDGHPILDLRSDALVVSNPKVNLEVNKVGEGSFTIYNDHPNYDKIKLMKSTFEVSDDSGVLFRGRMTEDSVDFYNGKAVDLEGAMAFFNDTIVRPYKFPDDFLERTDYIEAKENGNVVQFFFKWLVTNHNSQVSPSQRFKLGNVTVTDPNNYIFRENESYESTWSNLESRLFNSSLGGYLCIRYEADGNYIDYLERFDEENQQAVMFGENLLDFTSETAASETYSAIIPIGAIIEEETGSSYEGDYVDILDSVQKRLTLEGLANQEIGSDPDLVIEGDFIYSKSAVENIGWIYRFVEWDDVTDVYILAAKAAFELKKNGIKISNKIEAKAVDLNLSDDEIQSFRINKMVRVYSEPHNLNETYPLLKLSIPLLDPSNTIITVGETKKTLIDQQASIQNDLKNQIIVSQSKVEKEVNGVKDNITIIKGDVEQVQTDIELVVGDVDVIRNDIEIIRNNLSDVRDDMSTEREELNGELSDMRDEISGVKDDISGIRDDMSKAEQDLEGVRGELAESKQDLEDVRKDLTETQEEGEAISNRVTNNEGDISLLKQRADEFSVAITNAEGDISQLKQKADEFSTKIADNEGNISSLTQRADEFGVALEGVNGDIAALQLKDDELRVSIENAEGGISNLQQTANGFSVTISNMQGNISSLQQTDKEIKASVANAEGDISKLEQTAESFGVRIGNAEGDISVLTQRADEFGTRIGDAEGDISALQQTSTEIKASVSNAEGDISVLKQTAEGFVGVVENIQGDISQLQQTADGFSTKIENAEGDISELQQAAEGFSTTVGNMQDEISQIKQTAGEVSVVVANGDGTLSSIINPEMVSIARTDKNGNITSGFFFDADDGEFKFYGSGEFRSSTGSSFYTRVEGNEIVLYNGFDDKIHIGVQEGVDPDGNVFDYSYIVMGEDAHDNIGLIKKFYNGLWYGNATPRYLTGNFQAMPGASGLFVNTKENKVYVVNGTEMQNIYTGEAVARFA